MTKSAKDSLPWRVNPDAAWYHGSTPILAADGKEIARVRARTEFDSVEIAEMICKAVNAMHASGAIPVAVVLDGGLVQTIMSSGEFALEAAVIDYDTDGAAEEEITEIPQDNGTVADACCSFRSVYEDGPWVERAFAAIRDHDESLDETKH